MIVMVGMTVLCTVVLANLSNRSRDPVPAWMDFMVLKVLSRIVCLHEMAKEVQNDEKAIPSDTRPQAETQDTSHKSPAVNGIDSEQFHGSILTALANMKPVKANQDSSRHISLAHKWKVISVIVSRCFAVLFAIVVVACTTSFLIYIKVMSEIEFTNAVGEDKDKWARATYFAT